MSIRKAFVEKFGEHDAVVMERAAKEHANGVNSERLGSDPFSWAIVICIGHECFTHERYRKYHGFTADPAAIKEWVKNCADLASHDGDVDYLSLFAGAYNEYMPTVVKS